MGLLDRIGAFDRYKVSPTQGTSGLLTGAQQPMSPFAQRAARQIGGALGMDMRTPNEKLTQGLSQIDPNDPQKMAKMYGLMVQFGTPEQKIAATQKLQELAQQKQEAQRQENYRQSLITTADSIGMGDLSAQITNASPEELRDLGKEIGKRQIQLAARGDDDKASLAYLQGNGISEQDARAQYGDDIPPIEDLEKIVTIGDKGAIKAFVGDDGKARMYSVLGGKVLIDGKWVKASDANLAPAPQQVQTQELDGLFGKMPEGAKELVNESISNTIKDGQDADEILRTNAESQRLLDTGEMFTGLAANALVTFGQIGSVFGFDASSAEATQQFTLQRFSRVADIIEAYGAGTGLSDADREFSLQQAGVATLELGTLRRLLEIERTYATEAVTNRDNLVNYLTENEYMTPQAAGVFQFTRKTAAPAPATTGLSSSAQQYIQ